MNREFLSLIGSLTEQRATYCVATVIEVIGSSSAPLTSRAVFDAEGNLIMGWVGGGCAHNMVAHAALESLEDRRPNIIDIDLTDEIFGAGMPCGGHMRVFIEPCHPNPVLWLLGHGALVDYLCHLASDMGFDVILHHHGAPPTQKASAIRVIHGDERYEKLLPQPSDLVVIATHHKGDILALHQALSSEAAYIGLIASQHRSGLILNRLRKEGISDQDLSRIKAPAGIMIGSRTHREIALSIVAELISYRRGLATKDEQKSQV